MPMFAGFVRHDVPLYKNVEIKYEEHHPATVMLYRGEELLEAIVLQKRLPKKHRKGATLASVGESKISVAMDATAKEARARGSGDFDRLAMWELLRKHGLQVQMKPGAQHAVEYVVEKPEDVEPKNKEVVASENKEDTRRRDRLVHRTATRIYEYYEGANGGKHKRALRERHEELEERRLKEEL